jgi:hypothetical protein
MSYWRSARWISLSSETLRVQDNSWCVVVKTIAYTRISLQLYFRLRIVFGLPTPLRNGTICSLSVWTISSQSRVFFERVCIRTWNILHETLHYMLRPLLVRICHWTVYQYRFISIDMIVFGGAVFLSSICNIMTETKINVRRAVDQAVSRLLPIEAARVPAQVRACGICSLQSGTGAGVLRVLRFPLLSIPHSSS